MKIYYVADAKRKTRIKKEFRRLETATLYCIALNKKEPGRFMAGDWVTHDEFGVDTQREWPWVSQSDDPAYLV